MQPTLCTEVRFLRHSSWLQVFQERSETPLVQSIWPRIPGISIPKTFLQRLAKFLLLYVTSQVTNATFDFIFKMPEWQLAWRASPAYYSKHLSWPSK